MCLSTIYIVAIYIIIVLEEFPIKKRICPYIGVSDLHWLDMHFYGVEVEFLGNKVLHNNKLIKRIAHSINNNFHYLFVPIILKNKYIKKNICFQIIIILLSIFNGI